jgi:hypothetical protein
MLGTVPKIIHLLDSPDTHVQCAAVRILSGAIDNGKLMAPILLKLNSPILSSGCLGNHPQFQCYPCKCLPAEQ